MKAVRTTRRVIIAATAIALAAAAACSSVTSPSVDGTTLTLVAADYGTGPDNTSTEYWQQIADAFHQANPTITVQVQTINWNDFDSKIKTMVQNRQYPDLIEGDFFGDYATGGLLYPASEVMSPDTLANQLPVFVRLGTIDGTQYGMPFTTSAQTLFYNKVLFRQAGISSPPQSWNDIRAAATKIKELGKIGFGLPLGPEASSAETLLWLLGNGGNYKDAAGNWAINSRQNIETFEFLTEMVRAGETEPNPETKNRTDLWKQFAQGEIGMINGQGALIPIIEKAGVLKPSEWASVPIAGKNGPLDKTLGVGDFVSAFKGDGSKKNTIREFLDFVYQDRYQIQFAREYDLLPATVSAVESLSGDPVFGPFLKALPNSVQLPGDASWNALKNRIQQTIGTAVTRDPREVLDFLQAAAVKEEGR